jgi:hypothetical protein
LTASASAASAGTAEYEAQKRALLQDFFSCVTARVLDLDDRTSDASTISRGAVAFCGREADAAALANAGNYSDLVPRFRSQLETSGVETGLAALLKARADAARSYRASPAARKAKAKPKGDEI